MRTGSRNEVEPGKSGFAHFFEHLMFRGSENYTAEKYNAVIKEMGADSNLIQELHPLVATRHEKS